MIVIGVVICHKFYALKVEISLFEFGFYSSLGKLFGLDKSCIASIVSLKGTLVFIQ